MATKSRLRSQYVSVRVDDYVDVKLSEILEGVDDETLQAAYAERFSGTGVAALDELAEVEWFLLRGQPQAALALIHSIQNAARYKDDYRLKQLSDMRAARESVQ